MSDYAALIRPTVYCGDWSHACCRSKVLLSEYRHAGHRFLNAADPAAILRQCDFDAAGLPRACFAAQLRNQLINLPETGRADRMAFGFETAGRINGVAKGTLPFIRFREQRQAKGTLPFVRIRW